MGQSGIYSSLERNERKMLNIKVLKALNGDCIIISYGEKEKHNILIDGGQGRTGFRQLCTYVDNEKKAGNKIDLLILTHIDSDHIDGILRLLSQKTFDFSLIDEMWFDFGKGLNDLFGINDRSHQVTLYANSTEISWKQGADMEEIIQEKGIRRRIVTKLEQFSISGASVTILSPSKEVLKKFCRQDKKEKKATTEIAYRDDYQKSIVELNQKEFERKISLTNKSSIACLFQFKELRILLLGDSDPEGIVESLMELGYSKNNKLKVEFCKIAHHASRHNTSNELIQILDCSNYIISTQQTNDGRPSKECLSRIICNSEKPINFYCNYKLDWNNVFTEEEFLKYGMKFFLLDEQGIDVGEK